MFQAEHITSQASTIARPSPPAYPSVEYCIILSPTYRVPVLYFTLHNLPPLLSPISIDTVYTLLVPQDDRNALERIGVMGAISMGVRSFIEDRSRTTKEADLD